MRAKQRAGRTCFGCFLGVALVYIIATGIVVHLTRNSYTQELAENKAWVASSRYWLDRQLCRWIGVCGLHHCIFKGRWTWNNGSKRPLNSKNDTHDWWTSGKENPDSWSRDEIKLREIPQFVLDHAPYVHLFSREEYWPSDVAEHLQHVTPFLNFTKIADLAKGRNLTNLNELNNYDGARHGRFMYLQSDDNVEESPEWLTSVANVPKMPKKPFDYDVDVEHPLSDLRGHASGFWEDAVERRSAKEWPVDLLPSENGRCGGSSGFTCRNSDFGACCSIYGWCGDDNEFCGNSCNPVSGDCYNSHNPPRLPHRDLRRDLGSDQRQPEPGGRSAAPAILIVSPKEDGILDAFWFFFYSYNRGQKVLNIRFGNHVGDWEHTCVRFKNGEPYEIFLSEHEFGQAFTWRAMEKYIPSFDGSGTMIGSWSNASAARHAKRAVVYSAVGSHAMYGTPGLHPYVLPGGILADETDRGPLWDPMQNLQSYTYDSLNQKFRASLLNPKSPTEWLDYAGHWGDKYYALSDPRQYRFAGQYHNVNGPTGPKFKNLGRSSVCQCRGNCQVRTWLGGSKPAQHSPDEEKVEEGGLPGGNYTEEA